MKGPVPTGFLIWTFGLLATWSATDALRMYVVPRMDQSPVYCGLSKCRVTLLPETVGADAWVGTPGVSAAGFIIALKVAATSAGPKLEPSLNLTFWRTVTWRSLPPFWKAYAVANQGWVPAAVGSNWSNSTSGSLTRDRVPMLEA